MDGKKTRKSKETKEAVTLDLGFGGLFKGLGDLIDLVSDMAEEGEHESTHQGEFKVKGMGEKARGVYGFTIRTGIGGLPKVERFGNIRSTEEGPIVADVREPMVDVFDEGQEIVVVVELPGASEEDIRVEVEEDIVTLETTGARKYAKEVLLPKHVAAATLGKSYKNGILELRLKKAKE